MELEISFSGGKPKIILPNLLCYGSYPNWWCRWYHMPWCITILKLQKFHCSEKVEKWKRNNTREAKEQLSLSTSLYSSSSLQYICSNIYNCRLQLKIEITWLEVVDDLSGPLLASSNDPIGTTRVVLQPPYPWKCTCKCMK